MECVAKVNGICTKHNCPIQLPSLSVDIPGYLTDIIVTCRFESPIRLLPVWELLRMFPPAAEENQTKKASRGYRNTGSRSPAKPLYATCAEK
jgi:hypothetical protein